MAIRGMYLILVAVLAATGCANQIVGRTANFSDSLRLKVEETASPGMDDPIEDAPRPPVEPSGEFVAVTDDTPVLKAAPVAFQPEPSQSDDFDESTPGGVNQPGTEVDTAGPLEEVTTPPPAPVSRFKSSGAESEYDRFGRQVVDVPVDIRPSEGLLPEDIGAEKFAAEPTIDETYPGDQPADIYCSYTPWTICYRPLYFEDIALERYGKNVGYLQTGLSGVRFFSSVAALPYKMTRRPPRSCECSNGFSRPGDCPLPGYGNRRFEWDAALVEAAVVTAFVYIIP